MYAAEVRRPAPRPPGLHHGRHRRDGHLRASTRRAPTAWRTCCAPQGLQRLDHYSIFMENNSRYLEACGAGERSGLYYTCVNSYLTADELAYIVNNSESKAADHVARQARRRAARRSGSARRSTLCLVVDGDRRRRRRSSTTRSRGRALPGHADRRRAARHADALLVGHHRPAQGHPAPAAGEPAVAAAAAVRLPAASCGTTARA